jgi:hypothetical protein
MQTRISTYGLLTVACAALTTACGEADNSRRMMLGQGGGSTGNGNGGSGGNTTGMGGTNATGMGGGAGNSGLPPICSGGCVELNVPIPAGAADAMATPPIYRQAQFLFRPGTNTNMSTTVVTWRVKAAISTAGIPATEMYVAPFAQNGMALNYSGLYGAQIPLTPDNGFMNDDTWVNIVMDIPNAGISTGADNPPDAGAGDGGVDGGDGGAAGPPDPVPQASTLDATQVFQWGLYVGAIGATAGTVRVAVDSVDYEGGTDPVIPDVSFVENAESFQLDNYQVPTGAALVHRL